MNQTKLRDLLARAMFCEFHVAPEFPSWFRINEEERQGWQRVADYVIRMDEGDGPYVRCSEQAPASLTPVTPEGRALRCELEVWHALPHENGTTRWGAS